MTYRLRIAGRDHKRLRELLYPGDGFEAAAIVTCGHLRYNRLTVLLIQRVYEVPAEAYNERRSDYVEWRLEWMTKIINDADSRDLSIIRLHSHPSGFPLSRI